MVKLIIIFFILVSCEKKMKNYKEFDKFFISTNRSMIVSDSIFTLCSPNDVLSYNQNEFIFSELLTRRIYEINMSTSKIKVVGNYGAGPGEYKMPNSILKNKDHIYFNDLAKPKIEIINTKGEYVNSMSFPFFFQTSKIRKNSKMHFFLFNNSNDYYLKNEKGTLYFKVPDVFQNEPFGHGSPQIEIINDHIYFVNVHESKLFHLNTVTNKDTIMSFNNFIPYYNWEDIYNDKLPSESYREIELSSITNQYLKKIVVDDQNLLLLQSTKYISEDNIIHYFLILDLEGNILFYTSTTDRTATLFTAYNDFVIISYLNSEDHQVFVEYKINLDAL